MKRDHGDLYENEVGQASSNGEGLDGPATN